MILAGENNDKPFDKKASAATIAAKKGLKDFAIVEVRGGWGIDDEVEKGYGKDPTPGLVTTAPWNGDDNVWAPDIFKLKKTRSGFRVRFCDPDPENIESKLNEGWVIADCVNYGLSPHEEHGHIVKKKGMILMEIPETRARQREVYMKNLTDKRTLGDKELEDAQTQAEASSGEAAGSTVVRD